MKNLIDTKEQARILKVLSMETRIRIVYLLKGRSLCVNALATHLQISQGAVSQHLRVMRNTGLVIDEKRGYYVHYRLNGKTLALWKKMTEDLFSPDIHEKPDTEDRPRRDGNKNTEVAGR
jgi:DNA-binding transcriptional ArsR family regulator